MVSFSTTKIKSSPLRLIGLYLRNMDRNVSKNLSNGWYPFGNFEQPNDGYVEVPNLTDTEHSIYRINSKIPQITINCIVGKNGAGKSSLLDIMYRVINNLAYRLSQCELNVFSEDLQYAYGVDADLYFICDRKLHRIACEDIKVSFYSETKPGYMSKIELSTKSYNDILKRLFYSISLNYSIYAFNDEEYGNDAIINGNWLKGLFHKNDGYSTPITLVPYREHGVIDVKRENELAHQRILTFSLLSLSLRKDFPYGYRPRNVIFKIKKDYTKEKWTMFIKKHSDIRAELLENLRVELENVWEDDVSRELVKLFRTDSEMYKLVLFYLSYKSLKICLTYDEFKVLLERELHIDDVFTDEEYLGAYMPQIAERIVVEIKNHPIDHITLKIHQCLNYIKRGNSQLYGKLSASSYVKQFHAKTYDDAFVHLMLPSFFDMDIEYIRKTKVREHNLFMDYYPSGNSSFTLNKMSSGEKQMMFMISYVIYHLKNIQSVGTDNYRIPYHHVCLIFDEAELYYHPEYQRKFISMLLESLSSAGIDRRKIRSINIVIATHSPFILSDVLTQNTL